uniref:Secreted protein n=1 Tax=Ixodes ricinus TaxID=34613 RepID=A0A6B0TSH9_IXORI
MGLLWLCTLHIGLRTAAVLDLELEQEPSGILCLNFSGYFLWLLVVFRGLLSTGRCGNAQVQIGEIVTRVVA